ncbi:unnamed protein product [Cyprideis torosa]|uniref:Uncharacterized protein n=1 Tax=Cyprideis torosa TaxID=163714 RepID=A0A7R8W2I1_9CRUS|nr:unnamed protein product [Cyprideis torosa]CAG0881052.1 unnamed protein product [Cyprideis torosa]
MSSTSRWGLSIQLIHTALAIDEIVDVVKGEGTVLQCAYDTRETLPTFMLWRRSYKNKPGSKLIAYITEPLGSSQTEVVKVPAYRLEFDQTSGSFNLHIPSAVYDRDNALFECSIEGGEKALVEKSVQVTVLVPPGPPRIHPNNPLAVERSTVELTCESFGGSPSPQINWYRVGMEQPLESVLQPSKNISLPSRAIYRFKPLKEDDGAKYKCVVWNRALHQGSMLEAFTEISVQYFPRVKVGPPSPLLVEEGASVRLECHVDAKPSVSGVRWLKEGRAIGRDYTQLLDNVNRTSAGMYTCEADNGLGQRGQSSLELQVLFGPVIAIEGITEVSEREPLDLHCRVESQPPASVVEWFKVGDNKFRHSGPHLRIPESSARDAGLYMCQAVVDMQGLERRRNSTVEVKVSHAPGEATIVSYPPMGVVGRSVTLSCRSDPPGYPDPMYRWWRQDHPNAPPLAMGRNLTLPRVDMTMEGAYQCRAQNAFGSGAPSTYNLRIAQPPKLVHSLPPTSVRSVGDLDFAINCSAMAKPKPSVIWLKNGIPISETSPLFEVQNEEIISRRHLVTLKSTLVFRGRERIGGAQLTPEDRGQYSCLFNNEVGEEESTLQLRMQHEPVSSMKIFKVAADVGASAILDCRVWAFPRPAFSWSFNGRNLNGDSVIYETNSTAYPGDQHGAVLKILKLKKRDYGDYTCRAENELGAQEIRISLQKRGPPDTPPLPPSALDRGSSWLLLSWEAGFDGGDPTTRYIISSRADTERTFECKTSNPCNITGLDPQTTYILRVKASNSWGTSDFSPASAISTIRNFSTLPMPDRPLFGINSRSLVFGVIGPPVDLRAIIQIRNEEEGNWRIYREVLIEASQVELHVEPSEGVLEAIRVQLCLAKNATICGDPIEAHIVPVIQNHLSASQSFPMEYLVVIIICFIVMCVLGVVGIFCCCRRPVSSKDKGFTDTNGSIHPNLVAQQPPPPYYTNGVEKGALAEEAARNQIYGPSPYISYQTGPLSNVYPDQPSYSNSNAGGSVNSQDSLWKPQPEDSSGGYKNPEHHLSSHQGFLGSEDYGHYPATSFYNSISTFQQQTMVTSGTSTTPEDMLGISRNRELSPINEVYQDNSGDHRTTDQFGLKNLASVRKFSETMGRALAPLSPLLVNRNAFVTMFMQCNG